MRWRQRVAVGVWLCLMGWLVSASWDRWTLTGLLIVAAVTVAGSLVVAGVLESGTNTARGVDDWSAMVDRERAGRALRAASGGDPSVGRHDEERGLPA